MSSLRVQLHQVAIRFTLAPPLMWGLALQLPVFAVLAFMYLHRPVSDPAGVNYDVRLYFDAATAVLNGELPYRDFIFQYPPLALPFFVAPRLLASDLAGYFTWFNVELLAIACLGVLTTAFIARRIGQSIGLTLLLYSVGLIAIGSIVPQRYDLVPAILVVLGLAAWLAGMRNAAWVIIAIATATKVYPALLMPLLLTAEWRRAGARAAARGLIIFAGVCLASILPFLALAPKETLAAFGGQAGRGIEIESTFASLMLIARPLGAPAEIVYHRGLNTWDVVAPGSELMTVAAQGFQVGLLALLYLRFWSLKGDLDPRIIPYSAAAIGVALITGKVFSPQYILWLFPLPFLTGERSFASTAALFLFAALLTQLLFPFLWTDLKQGLTGPLLVALLRDLCLVALCFLLIRNRTMNAG